MDKKECVLKSEDLPSTSSSPIIHNTLADCFVADEKPFLTPIPEFMDKKNSAPKRKKKNNLEKSLIETMKAMQQYLGRSNRAPSSNSEDELFCKSIFVKIAKFPLEVKNDAKINILRYLNEVEMGVENDNK